MEKKINVNLKKNIDDSYEIIIGSGILDNIGEYISGICRANIYIIISDSNVSEYYADIVSKSLDKSNLRSCLLVFRAGEENKSRNTKEILEDRLLERKAGRDSCIIALGGGVTGDLAGFIAATYQRGIPFIQVPTTLLSQVDSSIGGKVAVDTPYAKNMIGAFFQPKGVFIDVDTLSTLPDDIKLNGIGEIIKHAIIKDDKYFDFLEENTDKIINLDKETLIETIAVSCKIKSKVVEEDEKEGGLRKILNFGHTIGHAVEALMDYRLIHDVCVGIGIYYESKIAYNLGRITGKDLDRIKNLLTAFGFSLTIPGNLTIDQIIEKTYLDKKVRNNKVEYALPHGIGKAEFNLKIDDDIVRNALLD